MDRICLMITIYTKDIRDLSEKSVCMIFVQAYDEVRNSKVLILPSRRTLRDYKNAIRPEVGFDHGVVEDLAELTKNLKGHQRNITLSFDEVKIQEDLVFDKHTGELIGFVDLGDSDLNSSTFKEVDTIATHCLVFYVRGISTDLKFSFAYFATVGATGAQLMLLFWKAVSILELTCKLKVVVTVSDGASFNRAFFKCHKELSQSNSSVIYRTINIFSPERRFIYFISDSPHLMKTMRNAMYHSQRGGVRTRDLWNCNPILWNQIVHIVQDDINRNLKLLPKLTLAHISLTSYSAMTVSLATQVLSSKKANVIYHYYPEYKTTGDLCQYMDCFFDCFNIRCQEEGKLKRKIFLEPFRDENDWRFDWLQNVFLVYFNNWKAKVEARTDKTDKEKERMFIPYQTFEV
eukprot:TCONS_00039477-protein